MDLVRACAQGAPGEWERFVQQYKRLITATVASVCGRSGAASCESEDIVAHVYERLLENGCNRLRAWRGESRLSTYLVQVTKNLCIDQLKKPETIRRAAEVSFDALGEVAGPAGEPSAQAETEELKEAQRAALRTAIRKLPAKQSMVMRLRLKGKSLREIAALMRIPEGTVFVENSRAMESLRKALEALGRQRNGAVSLGQDDSRPRHDGQSPRGANTPARNEP